MSTHFLFYFILLFLIMNMLFLKTYIFLLLLWLEIIILFFVTGLVMFSSIKSVFLGSVVIYTLTIAVCEASVALSLLVNLSRSKSMMEIKSLSLTKC